ncbi:hypothetical protein [Paraburkholderia tropica]|uniref:hypothetical protein n=2 Tax=Paraburkholderia tropica TaxID=92647 RepID=UPI0012EAAE4E|nr:hypothetical protein [Paraburkholderia tropica]MBB2980557.1 hypothetical protein [Paraburkholderia tropica]
MATAMMMKPGEFVTAFHAPIMTQRIASVNGGVRIHFLLPLIASGIGSWVLAARSGINPAIFSD